MVEIELEHHDVRSRLLEGVEAVIAAFHAIEQGRPIGRRGDVLVHQVDFTLQRLEQQHLWIGHHLIDHAIEVRQLCAFRVDLEVEWIAHSHRYFGVLSRRLGEIPCVQGWTIGVLEEGIVILEADLALEKRDPAFHPGLLRQLVGIRIVTDMELLKIMLGAAGELIVLSPCKLLQEEAVRASEADLEGRLVDHFKNGLFAVHRPE